VATVGADGYAAATRHSASPERLPSNAERARTIAREIVPVIAGRGFLVLTWRFRHQGRRLATVVRAVATVTG
jgi:hypothetical protein